jgi:hypothetical protein
MFTFRKILYAKIRGNPAGFRAGVAGDFIEIPEGLDAGQTTRASFRGSDWTVVNEGVDSIASGEKARIKRSEGLTLYVDNNPNQQTETKN